MDRREFLAAKRKPAKRLAVSAENEFRTFSGINPYNGPWTRNEVVHLLKRTMFGARIADVNYFASRSMTQSVDELLNIDLTPPSPPLKNYNNNNIDPSDPDYAINLGETWVNINTNDGTAEGRRRVSFKSWWVGQLINQDRTIREKMVIFWHNHFATQSNELGRAIWAYDNNTLLRRNALGNFKQLVKEVTLDVAMLRYLNGYLNNKNAPDENYARELQELFTLGKENNPNYTEDDVKQAAKVLTGWKINTTTNTSFFNANQHDTGNKSFSSFFNNTVIQGRTGSTAGMLELDDLLNMIFSKEAEVSRFIVKKIYRYFVYYKIDAAAEVNVIEPLALLLRSNNWEIKPVIEALLKSEHFYDTANQGCFIKTPVDLAVGLCREYEVVFPVPSDITATYNMWGFIHSVARILRQELGDPPDVAGWKAFYQEPQYYEIWINSDTLPYRNLFTDLMINTGYRQGGKTIIINPVEFTKMLPNAIDPAQLIRGALEILYRIEIKAETLAAIKKQILLSGQESDYYWSNAWSLYLSNPTQQNFQVVYTRLRDLYKYFMNLSEYHLS